MSAMENKKNNEEKKKKMLRVLGKVLLVAAALGISIAFSDINFVQKGHDFFMGFLRFTLNQPEEEAPVYTMEPESTASAAPSETETPKAEDTPEPTNLPETAGQPDDLDITETINASEAAD